MAKDPRFNFYSDNYEGGTEFFTLEEDGAYLRLLILQSRHGSFTERQALIKLMQRCPESPESAKRLWESIKHKFATDGNVFWSVRLKKEMDKSAEYSEKQAERAKARWDEERLAKAAADAELDAVAYSAGDASNSITNSNNNSTSNTNNKKNTAKADAFELDRVAVITELNELTGRKFDPHADYFKKNLNARIKQYGVEDLIDVVRFIVYKRKGTDWEQYLKPDTIFRADKCESYMVDMKHHRENGIMPKRDKGKGKTLLDPMQVMREVYQYHESKNQ